MIPTIDVGPLQLDTYKVLYGLAFLVVMAIGAARLYQHGYARWQIFEGLCLVALGASVGALAAYAIGRNLEYLTVSDDLLRTRLSDLAVGRGSSYIGVLVGGITATVLYCRWQRLPLGRTFDLAFIGLPLGQAIARLGCFCAGCCYGRPANEWPAIYLPDAQGVWAMRFPAQLVASAADLAIFFLLVGFERYQNSRPGKPAGWPFPGFLFLLYLSLYALKRFALEFYRDTAMPLVGSLTVAHISSLVLLLVSAALVLRNLWRSNLPTDLPKPVGS